MPFDGIEPLEKIVPTRWGNDKLAELEWLLRHPEQWNGWQWDFDYVDDSYDGGCGTSGCAMGIAAYVGLIEPVSAGIFEPSNMPTRQFAICHEAARRMFWTTEAYGSHRDSSRVTPLMVADAIRKYMTSGEV